MSHYEITELKRQLAELEGRITELARDLNGSISSLATGQGMLDEQMKNYVRTEDLPQYKTPPDFGQGIAKVFHTPLAQAMAERELQETVDVYEAMPNLENAAAMFDIALKMHVEQMIEDEAFHVIVQRVARLAQNGANGAK
jgi:hypothetical protein